MDEMNYEELESVFKKEQLDKINQMIEEKTLSWGNAILLLKQAGYCKELKSFFCYSFDDSSLRKRMPGMIIEEERRIEEKNERLLDDLCECYISLHHDFPSELLSICVPCLLKVALNKEESEETRKEVEIALLSLSCINKFYKIKQELYLKEITEIIEHQQKHKNLARLAYLSAWYFLICRFYGDEPIERVVANELRFAREARRKLEELMKCIDWKKNEEEMSKEEAKEELALMRWVETCAIYFQSCRLKNKDNVGLLKNIVQIYQAAKDNCRDISDYCTYPLRNAAENRVVKVEDLLNGGTIKTLLGEMNRSTMNDKTAFHCLRFFENICERLKEENRKEEMKGKEEEIKRIEMKRKVYEKMEEDGYEDFFAGLNFCDATIGVSDSFY